MTPSESQAFETLAVVRPAPARRVALIIVTSLLGFALLSIGLDAPEGGIWLRVTFVIAGVGMLWGGWWVWRNSAVDLVLTTLDLRQSDGRIICALADVTRVERGLAALRPATGFALYLREPMPLAWVPGLWWRRGRRVGIGGMTTRAGAKALADVIEAEVQAQRQAE